MIDHAMRLGRHALDRGDPHGAIEHFRSALGQDPLDPTAHGLLSIALGGAGRRHAALIEANRALECDPEAPLGHVAQALALHLHGDHRATEQSLDRALALDPENLIAVRLACDIAAAGDRPDRLADRMVKLAELEPDSPHLFVLGARLSLMEGKLDAAEGQARTALAAAPEYAGAHCILGWVLLRQGRTAPARAAALDALSFAPENPEAHNLLAHVAIRENPVLGLWQRLLLWLSTGGEMRTILVFILAWVTVRIAVVLLEEVGQDTAASVVAWVWIAIVILSWVSVYQYRKLIDHQRQKAELDPDY
jgi:Flp pilus assembly protein TadD